MARLCPGITTSQRIVITMNDKHVCKDSDEDTLIAHGWRQYSEDSWCRDDCAERGVAFAAMVVRLPDGRWSGIACGPYGDGPFHETLEEAKQVYDMNLGERGWTLLDSPASAMPTQR